MMPGHDAGSPAGTAAFCLPPWWSVMLPGAAPVQAARRLILKARMVLAAAVGEAAQRPPMTGSHVPASNQPAIL